MNEGKARSGGLEARPIIVRALLALVGLAAALSVIDVLLSYEHSSIGAICALDRPVWVYRSRGYEAESNELAPLEPGRCAHVVESERSSYFLMAGTDVRVAIDGRSGWVMLAPDVREERSFVVFLRRRWLDLGASVALLACLALLGRVSSRGAGKSPASSVSSSP